MVRTLRSTDILIYRMKRQDYTQQHGIKILNSLGLLTIAAYAFHALSSLLFSVIGLAPSSPAWNLALLLGSILAVSGIAVGLQTFPLHLWLRQIAGVISGATSGALLGFYALGQFSGQQATWAFVGAAIGGIGGGSLALWAYGSRKVGAWRRFGGLAIAISSSLCSYSMAFGLGTWMFAAINTARWGLSMPLALATVLYLWMTQRALVWVYRQWCKIYSNPLKC